MKTKYQVVMLGYAHINMDSKEKEKSNKKKKRNI